jgi:hypothetical protein
METSKKKAYDLKELGAKLKKRGLDLGEQAVKMIAEETFSWVEESAVISETPYDDMAMVVLPQLKKVAFESIDKIDGEEG